MEYKEIFEDKRNEFLYSVENAKEIQKNILLKIISENHDTLYGKKYNFENITSIEDFQNNLPITTYEDYLPYIKKIMDGEQNVLTSQEVILLEPTSGSSSSTKYIPYTKGLKDAFNNGIEPWLSDLFLNFPSILTSSMYWSITPTTVMPDVKSKIKIGFDNDFGYLNDFFASLIAKNIVIPNVNTNDIEKVKEITANSLKETKNLGLISVWNPSFFTLLLEKIDENPNDLWQKLEVVSCWDEANSSFYAQQLKEKLPNVYIQGKGLLSTEAIMTIPIENIGKLPCVNSHFYEFIDIESNEIKLLNELEINRNYSILLTTQGGFYRYKIGDIVTVYGFYKDCPLLSFIGRENNISDYVGEKLHEKFISEIMNKVDIKTYSNFYMFAPQQDKNGLYYVLYLEPKTKIDTDVLNKKIEYLLKESFHYKYARELGQLQEFRVYLVENGMKQYIDNCIQKGQKLGDIKPKTFSNCNKWEFVRKLTL